MALFSRKKPAAAKRGFAKPAAKKSTKAADTKTAEEREYEEFQRLKEKFEPKTEEDWRREWREMYEAGCDGDCDSCEYYDYCDAGFEDEEDDEPEEKTEQASDEEAPAEETADEVEGEADMTQTEDETKDEPAEEEDEPLTDEERALFDAAYAYYEAGCDGNCDECEYYDYCPAEEEVDPDDEEIMWGITQGDVQKGAENGINLAKETAQTAREFKEAMDDIRSVVDPREWFK